MSSRLKRSRDVGINQSEPLSDVQTAEKKLFNSLKGEFEGFVDRYFNRKVSRWFTRLFLAMGLSPNSITVLAGLVGLLAALGFGMGTYSAGIVAALLFQLAAVIDCCDGEVARLTFTESPLGAWLDIVLDNIVHMAIFTGIAVGLYTIAHRTSGRLGSARAGRRRGVRQRPLILYSSKRRKRLKR